MGEVSDTTQPGFGQRVRLLRRSRNWTQTDLTNGELSGSYLSLIESGHREPNARIVAMLAARLDVDVEYLLTGVDKGEREQLMLQRQFAELALVNGDAQTALETLSALRAKLPDDPGERWLVEHLLATAHERCGDLEAAIELLDELRRRGVEDPRRWPWLHAVIDLSRCYREAGDLARAVSVAEEALAYAEKLGLRGSTHFPRLVVTLAAASRERGDQAHAELLLRTVLRDLEDGGTRRDRGSALWNAAVLCADRGDFSEGIALAERALAQFAEEDDVRAEGLLRTTIAWMLLDSSESDTERALILLNDAHSRLEAAGMQVELAYTETELARAHVALGDPAEAITWARSSLHRLGASDRIESARARLALARALAGSGESAAAVEELEAAAHGLEKVDSSRQAAAVWSDLADFYASLGDLARARQAYTRALSLLGMPQSSKHVRPTIRTTTQQASTDQVLN